jgi:putative flippase GtrA
MKLRRKQRKEITRIAEYLITGGAYFWTGYLVFFIGDKFLHLNLWWAKLAANIIGWLVNYLLQRYWVFKNPKLAEHKTQVTTRYIIITLADFVIDYLIVAALKSAGITPYIGQFISSGFFTVWNYLWYRFWVFPQKFAKERRKARITPARVAAHRAQGSSAYHKLRAT